jgi:hypothetical protein
MRLNTREVQHYARYSGPADKQGHLLKRGAFNTQFKRRWFALKGNLLFYYRAEGTTGRITVRNRVLNWIQNVTISFVARQALNNLIHSA